MIDPVRDALAEFQSALTQLVILPTASGYGVDLVCIDDFTPNLDETDPTTLASLAQDNYHRIITDRGTLPDDLDYGLGLFGYLSQGITDADIVRLQGDTETELKKDDRNAEISATATLSTTVPVTLSLSVVCTPQNPNDVPFTLIIAVDSGGVFLKAIL